MKDGKATCRRSGWKVPGLRWWIAGLLFLATLISYVDRLTLSVLAPTICRELRLSNFEFASISVWFLLAYSVGQAFFGKLQDRIGTKTGLAIAMLLWSAAEVAQVLTRGIFSLSGCRFLLGLGEGGHWPAAIKGVTEWFPSEERGIGMGIVNTGATLGSALAPPLVIWLEISVGWRGTFIVTGLFGFLWLGLWLLCYQAPQEHPWIGPTEVELIRRGTADQTQAVIVPAWGDLLKNRKVQAIIVARLLGDPVWWLYLVWLPLYLFRARGLSLKAIGASAWIPFLCADVGALLGGWLSGWLIGRGWNPVRARGAAIMLGAVLTPLGVLVAGARSEALAIALVGLVLFAFQFWVNNVQVLTSDFFPAELVASVSGLAGTAAGIGSMIFILSTGWIVDRAGYSPVLLLSGLLVPAATMALVLLARDSGRTRKTASFAVPELKE